MATRHQPTAAAPQPANRGAALPAGKQKAAAAVIGRPDARNRKVLGDIGNVVNAHGSIQLPEGINRPMTRSFRSQLLKAQADAAAGNKNGVAALKPAARKPAKPVLRRPEPVAANINPGKVKKPSAIAGSSSAHKHSRKKVVNTLTSVLTARSKVACGLTEKPKELIENIDKLDDDNELAVVDYIDDIYKFYRTAQHESRPTDYMGCQLEVNPNMRAILADWIVEVHYKCELMPETLYLTMYIIDRYLSMQHVLRKELQLVGIAAMLISSKYEEVWAPEVSDFICLSDGAYSRQQILTMEKSILNMLQWNLTVPTPYVFLVRFVKAAGSDKELERMVFYFAELALMEYGMVAVCPSMVAAAAVYAARCTLKKSPLWTNTLRHHTGFSEAQLMECAKVLVCSHVGAPESKLNSVYKKYSRERFGQALQPPAAVQGI